ncbi:MAG: PIG-L family deacetylase, partial [Holophagales bacterium]|nr:PIG-L family deacetylase [Holophagales bacterium]
VLAEHGAITGIDPLKPTGTRGLEAVDRALARLSGHRRILMIAAHPDDEDTFVLALAARGWGAEAAYLSLSRGEGGQNLIGPELGEGLGLLRSGELQAARGIDGARQRFGHAYDFGYTRSLAETLERWPKAALLEDAVRAARAFRPQVLVTVFPGDRRAGHGQHQASGRVAERLFELSGDPEAHPELAAEGLRPWPIEAFYRASWWDPQAADLRLPIGLIEPFTGRSIFQIALDSRGQHRCQDMGFEQPPGDAETALIRHRGEADEAAPPVEGGPMAELFAGIDTSLAAIADGIEDPELRRRVALDLERLEATARQARRELRPSSPAAVVPALVDLVSSLARLYEDLGEAAESAGGSHALSLLAEKLLIAREGLASAAGIVADAITGRETVTRGEAFEARTLFWHGPFTRGSGYGGAGEEARAEATAEGEAVGLAVEDLEVSLVAPEGWHVENLGTAVPARSRFATRVDDERRFRITVAVGAEPSVPYFLRRPRLGDLYDVSTVAPALRGLPFDPAPLFARFAFRIDGAPMVLLREVVLRRRDQAEGEVRRPLRVVPAYEVSLDRERVVWRSGERRSLHFEV